MWRSPGKYGSGVVVDGVGLLVVVVVVVVG